MQEPLSHVVLVKPWFLGFVVLPLKVAHAIAELKLVRRVALSLDVEQFRENTVGLGPA